MYGLWGEYTWRRVGVLCECMPVCDEGALRDEGMVTMLYECTRMWVEVVCVSAG